MQSVEPRLLEREPGRVQRWSIAPKVVMGLTLEDASALVNERLLVFKALREVLSVSSELCRHLLCRDDRLISLVVLRVVSAVQAVAYLGELLGQVIVQLARASHER